MSGARSRPTSRGLRRRSPRRSAPRVAVLVEAPEWRKRVRNVELIARRAARAAAAVAPRTGKSDLCLVLANDRSVRRLNRQWRGKDKPTNVLSFPSGESRHDLASVAASLPLGDVIIAYGVTAAEAAKQGKTLNAHLVHLIVHGVLHLLGYDHERDAEAERMEALEIKILRRLGVADPYRRDAA
jgi:probable rRNA maturation factor